MLPLTKAQVERTHGLVLQELKADAGTMISEEMAMLRAQFHSLRFKIIEMHSSHGLAF